MNPKNEASVYTIKTDHLSLTMYLITTTILEYVANVVDSSPTHAYTPKVH